MDSVVLHYQELALKGPNRPWFLRTLVRHVRATLADLDIDEVRTPMGRIEVRLGPTVDRSLVLDRMRRIFGIDSIAVAGRTAPTPDAIIEAVLRDLPVEPVAHFRVRVRRAHKQFPVTSPELERDLGARIVAARGWPVRLRDAAMTVHVEVLPREAFHHFGAERGAGGLPTGTGGRVLVLLSGGIDSPVAAWRMMRRGCHAAFVHFHAAPFTSTASQQKARALVAQLATWQLGGRLLLVPFADVQREVTLGVPAPLRVVVARRLMMRIATALAARVRARALVTGEAIGQVASQTLDNLGAIASATPMLTLRPLIGADKRDIVDDARRIGTLSISELPDEDCCARFTPLHPNTRVRQAEVDVAEAALPIAALVEAAVAQVTVEPMAGR